MCVREYVCVRETKTEKIKKRQEHAIGTSSGTAWQLTQAKIPLDTQTQMHDACRTAYRNKRGEAQHDMVAFAHRHRVDFGVDDNDTIGAIFHMYALVHAQRVVTHHLIAQIHAHDLGRARDDTDDRPHTGASSAHKWDMKTRSRTKWALCASRNRYAASEEILIDVQGCDGVSIRNGAGRGRG